MDDRISARQFLVLVIFFTIGSSILFVPSVTATYAKQDAWISIVTGIGLNLLLVYLYIAVADRYPGLSLVELSQKLLGKWFGAAVAVFLIINAFVIGAVSLVDFAGTFVSRQIMPDTPVFAANILYVLPAVIGLRLGLRTIARAAEAMFPLITALFIIMILTVAPNINPEHLQPVFEAGFKALAKANISYFAFSAFPTVFLLMIYPSCVKEGKKASKAFLLGIFIAGLFLLIITTVCIAVLGAEGTARQAYSSYTLAKKINIADFFTRIEVLMATFWLIALYFKLVVYFYAGMKGLAQLFNMQNYRALVLPLGVISVALSRILYPSAAYRHEWDAKIWPLYVGTSGVIIPLLLLGTDAVKKRLRKR
ncbi:spore germination protein KB [Paenibacillus tianmuensis]|uniref:Spore germination protein KB n=1 Tax=Paenibacillus tianmuensis TaxID=624147 RepID=A0A1G4S8I5_9BACL|nr:endospore germination permease [Paenibacillus tianmuensis]SCW65321.1 spore germination protein KB [Paenibacillus tianmuensis]